MYRGTYRIAEKNIAIESVYEMVQVMCADYQTSQEADFVVHIDECDIDREAEASRKTRKVEGLPPYEFSRDYLETLAVYRKMVTCLLDDDILLFHGSVVAVDGQAYLFTAKSGTGKSTHVRLWRQFFGDRAVMVNDDKPLMKVGKDSVTVYGTPWDGKHHLSSNIAVPLKAICHLTRGSENKIEAITPFDACQTLLQQTFMPEQPEKKIKMLQLVNMLSENVKLYRLACNMDPDAAVVAYNGMKG